MDIGCRVYRPCDPRKTPLLQLLESLCEAVKLDWEERFEARYGSWPGSWDEAVAHHLDCGIWYAGFARVHCDAASVAKNTLDVLVAPGQDVLGYPGCRHVAPRDVEGSSPCLAVCAPRHEAAGSSLGPAIAPLTLT